MPHSLIREIQSAPSPHRIDDPAHTARREKSETGLLRRYAGELALWMFCRRAACYRAQACRGEPRVCIGRYAALVPEDACDAAKAMLADDDVSGVLGNVIPYDGDAEALADWRALVAQACKPA